MKMLLQLLRHHLKNIRVIGPLKWLKNSGEPMRAQNKLLSYLSKIHISILHPKFPCLFLTCKCCIPMYSHFVLNIGLPRQLHQSSNRLRDPLFHDSGSNKPRIGNGTLPCAPQQQRPSILRKPLEKDGTASETTSGI